MSNLSSHVQNIESPRSSIEDADFAAELAYLSKSQILEQPATAMLVQASAISQNVLGLLSEAEVYNFLGECYNQVKN